MRKIGYACAVNRQSAMSFHVAAYGTSEAPSRTSRKRPDVVPTKRNRPSSDAPASQRARPGTHGSNPCHLFSKG
jgi:hypothetical protein